MSLTRRSDRRRTSLRIAHRLLAMLAVLTLAVVTWLLGAYGAEGSPTILLFTAAIVGTALLTIGMTS